MSVQSSISVARCKVKTLDEVPAEIRRLHDGGRARGPNWTLPQIAEHLARTIDLTLGRLVTPEPSPIHLKPFRRFLARQMVLLQGRIPPNVPTLRALTPPADTGLHAALAHLEQSIKALHEARGPLPDHPFLGPMSKRAWLRFHLVHARHHLARLEESQP
jgi:Protein of unknown function (DUF1569)